MKHRFFAILFAVMMVLAVPAKAATRVTGAVPTLSFSGTTANCGITVMADHTTDTIEVTLKLWHGTRCLATWTADGPGYLRIKETTTVTSGLTYRLTADIILNDVAQPQVSVSARCSG